MTPHMRSLRAACAEFCAEAGDPPCYVLDERAGKPFAPCVECREICGETADEPIDPNAVVRPLL